MKIRVTMKDPDTLQDAIVDAVKADLRGISGISDREREALKEERACAVEDIAGRWFRFGEYLTVEIDTEAKTCVVVEAKDAD